MKTLVFLSVLLAFTNAVTYLSGGNQIPEVLPVKSKDGFPIFLTVRTNISLVNSNFYPSVVCSPSLVTAYLVGADRNGNSYPLSFVCTPDTTHVISYASEEQGGQFEVSINQTGKNQLYVSRFIRLKFIV